MARWNRSAIIRLGLLGSFLLAAAGCVAPGPAGSSPGRPGSDANPEWADRVARLESRIIGLTDELDRLSNRVIALEGGRVPAESSPRVPDAPPDEPEPPRPETPEPEETPAAPPDEPERDLDNWPTPAAGGNPPTSLLVDARELPPGALPSTTHKLWRILDPAGDTLLTHEDLDPELVAARPIFWVAERGRELGPAALPLLGSRPLRLRVAAAVMAHGEAIMTLDAASAEALRKVEGYFELAKAGSVAILLRKP